jgi:hypothetical protein
MMFNITQNRFYLLQVGLYKHYINWKKLVETKNNAISRGAVDNVIGDTSN